MQAIKHLYLYILLALIPSTIQATSTLATIDQCLNFIHLAEVQDRQCKAMFHHWISKDIERKIVLYLTSSERSNMRRVSSSCYNTIESVDHQQLLIQINKGKVEAFDDKTIKKLQQGDCGATLSFFLNEYHNLCKGFNLNIAWLSVLTQAFADSLFEYFEQRYGDLIFSSIYYTENRKKFLVPFYKIKGLSKNNFPNLFSDMFFELAFSFPQNISLVLECITIYFNHDMAKYINEILPDLPKGRMSFDQFKEYLAIVYKAGYLPLFGQAMVEDSYCFRKIAGICLQNKQQGKKLLGEICYVAFYHNPTKESMGKYHDIKKYVKARNDKYKRLIYNEDYTTFNEMEEVLSQLPKYKSLSLLTAVVAGLYKQ